MRQNYSKKLEMQIPQGNTYTEPINRGNIDAELAILSKNYDIRKRNELKEFIKKNNRLIPYIHSITPDINKYFPNHEKFLTYYTDPEFKELNSAMICVIGKKNKFEEEHNKMNALTDDILYSTEYPLEVKNLISVRM